jgi:dihydroxy-acid dehydratase
MGEALEHWDVISDGIGGARERYLAGPGGIPTQVAFSQDSQWPDLDLDRADGCIRDIEHAYSKTAASRCSTATLPRTAASSRPPAWT